MKGLVASAIAGCILLAAAAVAPAPPPPRPTMRVLDHPRCFPPGTLQTEGFPGCPDSLPDQRAA